MRHVELNDGELEGVLSLTREAFAQARAGRDGVLEELVRYGVPVDIRNEHGDSLLMLAVANGHLDAARTLLSQGADPELLNGRGESPIQVASRRDDDLMVVLLLEHCAAGVSVA